ncbi:MAG: gluconeogenesis factor YvcK family protein [Egibacteraceae bacterium]
MSDGGPTIVTIGGGTGSFVLLSGLRRYVRNLSAIVAMSDDGGSTGILRDELGVLPPGDVRQCLVALSRSPRLRDLFNYRFDKGTLRGHSFGNLFLTVLADVTGSFEEAVREAATILAIEGTVIPVTTHDVRLVARFDDGSRIVGEHNLTSSKLRQGEFCLSLEPRAAVNPQAAEAIRGADMVVVCPGNLYASVVPHFLVAGVGAALRQSPARKVFVAPLMNKAEHTGGFKVHDYVEEVERYVGGPVFDYVVFNTALPPARVLQRYQEEGEPVGYDSRAMAQAHYTAVGGDLLSRSLAEVTKGDLLRRTLIRHDPERIARRLMQLYWQ